MTPAGIEPATFRFVAQHLNHCATAVPQQILVLNILNTLYTLRFFSSKCSLFHNDNLFGSCIIHILYRPTGCAEIKKKIIPALEG